MQRQRAGDVGEETGPVGCGHDHLWRVEGHRGEPARAHFFHQGPVGRRDLRRPGWLRLPGKLEIGAPDQLATNPDFQGPHADGPVAPAIGFGQGAEKLECHPISRRPGDVGHGGGVIQVATRRGVRRRRWWRTRSTSISTSASPKPMRAAMVARPSCRPSCDRRESLCRCRATARRSAGDRVAPPSR